MAIICKLHYNLDLYKFCLEKADYSVLSLSDRELYRTLLDAKAVDYPKCISP